MIPDSLRKYVYHEESDIVLLHGDCLEILPLLEPDCVDLVLTDPPYTTPTITSFGREKVKSWGDFSIQRTYVKGLRMEIEKIIMGDGRLLMFCDDSYYPIIKEVFFEWLANGLIVWDKGRIGMGRPIRKQHELIFYACGESFESSNTISSVMKYAPVRDKKHGAEKPIDLVNFLIKSFNGLSVLDPFLGSGTTAVACKQLGRKCIGIEIESKYLDIAIERLRQEVLF